MDLIDVVLGMYLALVMHSLTMAWLTANGTRSVSEGFRCLADPAAAAQKEYFDWYVEQERRIRERDWIEQKYYDQRRDADEASLRGAADGAWTAPHSAWGEVCPNPMLPGGTDYTAPPRVPPGPQEGGQLPTVRGTLQTPVPTTGLPTSAQPMLQPLQGPPDDDDGYGAILSSQ